jgi:hypothetical protein
MYLSEVKNSTYSEVNEKTQSQRRVIEYGKRLVYAFSDTLFGSGKTIHITREGMSPWIFGTWRASATSARRASNLGSVKWWIVALSKR